MDSLFPAEATPNFTADSLMLADCSLTFWLPTSGTQFRTSRAMAHGSFTEVSLVWKWRFVKTGCFNKVMQRPGHGNTVHDANIPFSLPMSWQHPFWNISGQENWCSLMFILYWTCLMPYVTYVRLCGCASSITVPDLQNESFESLNSSIEQDRSPSWNSWNSSWNFSGLLYDSLGKTCSACFL